MSYNISINIQNDKYSLILLVPVVARTLLEMEHVIVQQNAGTNLVKQREDVPLGKLIKKICNPRLAELIDDIIQQHAKSIMKFSL